MSPESSPPTSTAEAERTDSVRLRPDFAESASPHIDELRLYALHLVKNEPDADDLLQDGLLRAMRSFGTFRKGSNIQAWLRRVLLTTFLSKCRREKLERRVSCELDQEPAPPSNFANDDFMESIDDRLRAALLTLSPECRHALLMRVRNGLTYGEIAKVIGRPIGTALSRVQRAKDGVRHHLLWKADTIGQRFPIADAWLEDQDDA